MKIIKATDPIPVEHPVFLIFGQPGICKSSLAYSCKDPLLLDFDNGAHRAVNRRDTLKIDSWTDVDELMADGSVLDGYSTLVVDTAGRCLDVLTARLAERDPKKFPGGVPGLQGYGVLKGAFRAWLGQLRLKGKDVLLVAHDKEEKDGDTTIVRPDLVGASQGEVLKCADFVGYVSMNGRDRVLDFNPTSRWFGKNPAGWQPFKVPAIGKAQDFMADLFDQGRVALGAISEASAGIAQTVEIWRAKFEALTTADALNAEMPLVKAIEHKAVQPQVAKLLMDRGAALQFEFDAKAKVFRQPVAA